MRTNPREWQMVRSAEPEPVRDPMARPGGQRRPCVGGLAVGALAAYRGDDPAQRAGSFVISVAVLLFGVAKGILVPLVSPGTGGLDVLR